jgi:4-amino-4-deoxy-L-arabinose transferase-like glycosyltransferase
MTKKLKEFVSKNQSKIKTILFYLALFLILTVGIFFRIWQLDSAPPGLQYDEAYNGVDAIKAFESNDYKVFYQDNNGREGFYINALALSLKSFGINNFSLRLISALFGILTLVGFFFLVRELKLSRLSSLLGTLMISLSFWHINFSRTTYRGIMVPFLIVWIFYFFFKGLKTESFKKSFWYFLLSGALTGLGFHSYISFRVLPLIFIILIVFFVFLKKDFIKKQWKNALVFFFSMLLAALPIFIYFYQNPADFTGRSDSVSIFNDPNRTFLQSFTISLGSHLNAFLLLGDTNQRHNHDSLPLLPTVWTIFFVIGFAISLKEIVVSVINRIKKKKPTRLFEISILGQSIFWVMLIPGVLSIEGIPHALRIIGVIPATFLLAILPFEYILGLYRKIKKSPLIDLKTWRWQILKISIASLILIIVVSGLMQSAIYFDVWSKDQRTINAFERKLYDLGQLTKQIEKKEHNFVITAEEIYISEDNKESSLKTTEFSGYPEIKKFVFWHPFDSLQKTTCKNALYVFQEADEWLVGQFQKKCPDLKTEKITPKKGIYEFWVIR